MKGFPIHPRTEEAIQRIDAALFNGDTFDSPENRAYLKEYVERWLRRIQEDEKHDEARERAEANASEDDAG